MNADEHRAEAERILSTPGLGDDPRDPVIVATAQTHALLAIAAYLAGDADGDYLIDVPSPRLRRVVDVPTGNLL